MLMSSIQMLMRIALGNVCFDLQRQRQVSSADYRKRKRDNQLIELCFVFVHQSIHSYVQCSLAELL